MSAPALRKHISDSIITFSSSIIFRTPPALIIEYSPDTWKIHGKEIKINKNLRDTDSVGDDEECDEAEYLVCSNGQGRLVPKEPYDVQIWKTWLHL